METTADAPSKELHNAQRTKAESVVCDSTVSVSGGHRVGTTGGSVPARPAQTAPETRRDDRPWPGTGSGRHQCALHREHPLRQRHHAHRRSRLGHRRGRDRRAHRGRRCPFGQSSFRKRIHRSRRLLHRRRNRHRGHPRRDLAGPFSQDGGRVGGGSPPPPSVERMGGHRLHP